MSYALFRTLFLTLSRTLSQGVEDLRRVAAPPISGTRPYTNLRTKILDVKVFDKKLNLKFEGFPCP